MEGVTISKELANAAGKYLNEGSTITYVVIDDVLAGYIVLSDTVREESKDMIAALGKIDVHPVLLTGDNKNAAETIASQLGISEAVSYTHLDVYKRQLKNRKYWRQNQNPII